MRRNYDLFAHLYQLQYFQQYRHDRFGMKSHLWLLYHNIIILVFVEQLHRRPRHTVEAHQQGHKLLLSCTPCHKRHIHPVHLHTHFALSILIFKFHPSTMKNRRIKRPLLRILQASFDGKQGSIPSQAYRHKHTQNLTKLAQHIRSRSVKL